ncbi:MAG: hypothetical protein ABUL77_05090, partial [Bacteroidota bacterium]
EHSRSRVDAAPLDGDRGAFAYRREREQHRQARQHGQTGPDATTETATARATEEAHHLTDDCYHRLAIPVLFSIDRAPDDPTGTAVSRCQPHWPRWRRQ